MFNTHRETKQEKDKRALARHVLMMSQRTKEGGMGIYQRGFLGIMREAQLGITQISLNLPQFWKSYQQVPVVPTVTPCFDANNL